MNTLLPAGSDAIDQININAIRNRASTTKENMTMKKFGLAAATLATATLASALSPAAAASRTSIGPADAPHNVCVAWRFEGRQRICIRWHWSR